MGITPKGQRVRDFILNSVQEHPSDIVKLTATHFSISRQAVHKHLKQLVEDGLLSTEGELKQKTYHLTETSTTKKFYFSLEEPLDEDVIWRENIKPLLQDLPQNLQGLWQYSFTEMVNNAIDHSGGTQLSILFVKTAQITQIKVSDNGEGIFHKIQRALNLSSPNQAIFELKKGKLTTDPDHHSGEGIFFTSRMCDTFAIFSDQLIFDYSEFNGDLLTERAKSALGTQVMLMISNDNPHFPDEILKKFEDADYGFAKTIIPLRQSSEDGNLISRSQAKRVLIRIDQFKKVILDFAGINTIGQGFADEVFRVFQSQHPAVTFYPINTNAQVSDMIKHVVLSQDFPSERGEF